MLILLTKLKVHIKYSHAQDNDSFKIQLRAWFGLLRYTFDVPLIKVDENSPSIVVEEETKTGKEENMNSEKRSQFFAQDIINGLKDMEKLLKHVVSLHRYYSPLFEKGKYQSIRMADGNWYGRGRFNWSINGGSLGCKRKYYWHDKSLF